LFEFGEGFDVVAILFELLGRADLKIGLEINIGGIKLRRLQRRLGLGLA